jgi:hypothetical protein
MSVAPLIGGASIAAGQQLETVAFTKANPASSISVQWRRRRRTFDDGNVYVACGDSMGRARAGPCAAAANASATINLMFDVVGPNPRFAPDSGY